MSSIDLLKIAVELESKKSKIKFQPEVLSTLGSLLLDVHAGCQPKPTDYENRRKLVQKFNTLAVGIFGSWYDHGFPAVEAFGSFTMDLFTSNSDLDLSINFCNNMVDFPRDRKISVLKKLAKVLNDHKKRGLVTRVLPILTARVPVLKVVDRETGVECDFSIENKDGISRSLLYSIVASIDERFSKLSYLMKAWAKAHDINSAKDNTLNSLSIISLVAFHLQTREPPILPPFSALLKDGIDASSVERNAAGFKQYGKSNQESIAKLFLALLMKLSSVETLWRKGLCASLFEGCWIYKKFDSRVVGTMNIEDFLNRFENFARSVGSGGMRKICGHVNISLNNISDFAANKIEASRLKELLFKPGAVKIPIKGQRVRKLLGKRTRNEMEQTKGKDKVKLDESKKTEREQTRVGDMDDASDQPKRTRQDSSTPATANSKGAKKPKFSKQTGIQNQPVYLKPVALPIIMLPPVQPQVCDGLYRPAPGFAPPQVHDAPDFVPLQVHDELYRPVPDFVSQQVYDGSYSMAPDFVPPPFRLYDHPQRPVPPFLPGYGNGHPAPFIPEPQSRRRVPSHQLSFHDIRYYPENTPFMDDVRYYPENPSIRHPGFGRQWSETHRHGNFYRR